MIKIGVTGSLASGKSTVAKFISRGKYPLFNADDIVLNEKTSNELKEKVFMFYIKTNKKIELEKFKKDLEILSILRNLKIIGIFTRLSSRDQKHYYLKLIPYTWKLIENRINNNAVFNDLKLFLDNNFSKKMRQKKWKK